MKKVILVLASSMLVFSCKKEEVINKIEEVVQLGTYDASTFKANTVNEREFLLNYKTLLAEVSKAKPGSASDSALGLKSKTLTYSSLEAITNTGVIKISDVANTNFKNTVLNSGAYLQKAVDASSNSHFTPKYPVTATAGGRFTQTSGYLFDQYGVCIEEMIQKTFYGSLYDKVFNQLLKTDSVSLKNIDRALVLYGAPTSFPNGLKIKVGSDSITDVYVAGYAARRDNSNGVGNGGFYSVIKAQFITLQKIVKTEPTNKTKIESTVTTLRKNWEMALMATAINYLKSSQTNLVKTAPLDQARALHSFGEVLALINGFKGVSATTIITQSQVDELLGLLNFSAMSATVNPLAFNNSQAELGKLQTAITKIQTIYSFTDTQVNDLFTKNDVSSRNIGMRVE